MRFSKKIFILSSILFLFLRSGAWAAGDEARSVIDKMIQKLRSHVNVASYEMTIERPSWKRILKIKVWDDRGKNHLFIRILEPPKEEGTSFLRQGSNLWSYLPKIEKTMKIPPSLMLQPWMGSDFTNDDLIKESSYIEDYTHGILSEEKQEGKTILQIELLPKPKAPVVWGKVVFSIWKEENLPLEQSFFDEKGKLIKRLQFSDFKMMDGVLMPTVGEMQGITKPGQHSILKTLSMDFDPHPALPEWIFSEQHFTRQD